MAADIHFLHPYDHQREDAISISLTPIEWSVLIAGAERSAIADCRELAARVAAEVMLVQRLRFQADVADADADYRSSCEWPEGA